LAAIPLSELAAKGALLGAAAAGSAPLLVAGAIKNRVKERVLLGPGDVVVGFELETRGRAHSRHALSKDQRDHRRQRRIWRFAERKAAPFLCPAHIWRLMDRVYHVQILGPTGGGKTTIMENLIAQDLREGSGVFILETAGDLTLKAEPHARAFGRPTIIVDPSRPEETWKINPMAGDPTRVAQTISAAFKAVLGSGHEFFEKHNETMIQMMVYAAKAHEAATGKPATLETVLRCSDDEAFLRNAIQAVDADDPARKTKKNGQGTGGARPIGSRVVVESPHLTEAVRNFFERRYFGTMSARERGEFTSGMKTALFKLIEPEPVRAVLCPRSDGTERELVLEEALERGAFVSIRLEPGACGGDNSLDLAVYLLRAFMGVIERRPKKSRPVMAYFDEIHTFFGKDKGPASNLFESFVSTARHKNCAVHCGYQDEAQIPEELAAVFATNLRNKIFLGGLSAKGAKTVQDTLASDARELRDTSRTEGESERTYRSRMEDVPRWSINEIMQVPVGQAIAVRVHKGNTQYGVLVQTRLATEAGPPSATPAPTGAPDFLTELAQRREARDRNTRARADKRARRSVYRGREAARKTRQREENRRAQDPKARGPRGSHLSRAGTGPRKTGPRRGARGRGR